MAGKKLNILIIKLGALGDFVQATTAFKALRNHYQNEHLTLLTTAPYVDFANRLKIFDSVVVDPRPKWHEFQKLKQLISVFRQDRFDIVIDLQGVDRTRLYKFFPPGSTQWIGAPSSCKFPHPQDRFREQLSRLGIKELPELDLRDLREEFPDPLPSSYALIIPGASQAHKGQKRWPEACYAKVAKYFLNNGILPVIIGGKDESFNLIEGEEPKVLNLSGKTSFYQVIGLAENALVAIGNDTGPMLLAASGGCPTITFFSSCNPPEVGGPRGSRNLSLYAQNLNTFSFESAIEKSNQFLLQ